MPTRRSPPRRGQRLFEAVKKSGSERTCRLCAIGCVFTRPGCSGNRELGWGGEGVGDRVWQGMLTVKGHAAPLTSVSFSPNGEFIATGSRDGTTRLWSFDNGKEIAKLASTGPVWQVAFSPDGAILGVSTLNYMALWDVKTRKKLADLKGHTGGDRVALCFSPDGRTLATGSSDGTIRLWKGATYQQIVSLDAFIPDKQHAAALKLSKIEPFVIYSLRHTCLTR